MDANVICVICACITLIIVTAILVYGRYIREHGPLEAWKNASLEAYITKHQDGHIMLKTPKGRLAASQVKVKSMKDECKNLMVIAMEGEFDLTDFQNLL